MSKKEYKLYRNVNDILTPSISRKNISEYNIIFKDGLIPVQVFYPSINVKLDKVAIYIRGREICNDFYEEYALKTGNVVLVVDYNKDNMNEIYNTVGFIFEELIKCDIDYNSLSLVGDFLGSDIIIQLGNDIKKSIYSKIKKVLISPTIDGLNNFDFSNTLVLSNNEDFVSSDSICVNVLKESLYDFIHDIDTVANEKIYKYILDFIEE